MKKITLTPEQKAVVTRALTRYAREFENDKIPELQNAAIIAEELLNYMRGALIDVYAIND